MRPCSLEDALRRARRSAALAGETDFSAAIMSRVAAGENPWLNDWSRFLWRWAPPGLLLIVLLAWAMASLPHGEHGPGFEPAAANLFSEVWP